MMTEENEYMMSSEDEDGDQDAFIEAQMKKGMSCMGMAEYNPHIKDSSNSDTVSNK